MFKKFKYSFGRLEIAVFITGMNVMIIEMVGARILAPFFGNSIYVWTSIIGIILASLSFGYYYGGRLADKRPDYQSLGLIILLAGLVVGILTIFKPIILSTTAGLGIKIGSVTASIMIFALPSIFLGMVSPFAARLKIDELKTSGKTVGYLYAISTLGSIFGTFLAGFWLITWLGSTIILYVTAVVLIIISILAGKFKRGMFLLVILLALIMLMFFIGNQRYFSKSKYVYEKDTQYNHIRVIDDIDPRSGKKIRALVMGQVLHSAEYLEGDDQLFDGYVRFYRLDKLYNHKIEQALMIGGGAYSVPKDFLKRMPAGEIDVVEIDPEVTRLARDFFGLKNNARINIFHEDGRVFLNRNNKKYDAIYLDAFGDYYSIPFQLTTIEAVERIYQSLADDGVVILNIIGALEGDRADLVRAEYKNYSTYFPTVHLFAVHTFDDYAPDKVQNVMLIASKKPGLDINDLFDKTESHELEKYLNTCYQADYKLDQIRPLTDEFAPVENYVLEYL